MAIVTFPLCSMWASGSMSESITFKWQKNKKFVVAKHCNPWGKIGEVQKIWANEMKRKMQLGSLCRKNVDLLQVVNSMEFKES